MNKVLLRLAMGFVLLAAISAVVMLANDSNIGDALGRWSVVVSAAPLLAVGLSFVIVQPVVRPPEDGVAKKLATCYNAPAVGSGATHATKSHLEEAGRHCNCTVRH